MDCYMCVFKQYTIINKIVDCIYHCCYYKKYFRTTFIFKTSKNPYVIYVYNNDCNDEGIWNYRDDDNAVFAISC